MKTSDFLFDLPEERIARYPPPERGDSRLMTLDRETGDRRHNMVSDLPEILARPEFRSPNGKPPLLVFNNSRVRKARIKTKLLSAIKAKAKQVLPTSGGADSDALREAEFLLLNRIDPRTWRVMVNRAKRRRPKQRYCFDGGMEGEIVEAPTNDSASSEFRYLRFDSPIDDTWLDIYGHIPLPPYIKRDDEESDSERYQTIYSDRAAGADLGPGASAAAPTAGLHFTEDLLTRLKAVEIETAFITLHVGLGTFLPVRSLHIEDHVMHEESYSINEETARLINAAKAEGRKIVAVGTTSLRTLESANMETNLESIEHGARIKACEGTTSIFIYPGYRFNIVDALFTNFHTPGSTLLMLVSAFAGRELIMNTYAEAIREEYRFFSYGDAMLIY